MRQAFIGDVDYGLELGKDGGWRVSKRFAQIQCPWAAKIVKVEGGYKCFEGIDDYEIWKNQK